MKLGSDLWVLYPKLGLEKTLELFEEMGLEYFEYPYEMFKDAEDVGRRIAEAREAAGSYKLVPYQLHAEYGDVNFELSAPDPSVRRRALNRLKRWVEYASQLEVEVLVVHAAFPRPSLAARYDEVIRRVVKLNLRYAKALARAGEKEGVTIALENCVEPWFCSSPLDLLYLVEEVGSERFKVCVDTGHFNVNSIDPAEAIEKLSGHIAATHIHDNDGKRDQHLPPLSGCIDWRRVVTAFEAAGYGGPLIYEFGSPPGQSPSNAAETLKLVTEYLASLARGSWGKATSRRRSE